MIVSLSDPAPEPAGIPGVFLVETAELAQHDPPWFMDRRPIRAFAPHPTCPGLTYVTMEHPDLLAFLPDECVELV